MGGNFSKPKEELNPKKSNLNHYSERKIAIYPGTTSLFRNKKIVQSKIFQYDGPPFGETFPVTLPPGIPLIILNYLSGDINANKFRYSSEHRDSFRLFGAQIGKATWAAMKIGEAILSGESKKTLDLALENPTSLRCISRSVDFVGRKVEGYPLALAAMAGNPKIIKLLSPLLTRVEAEEQFKSAFPPGWEVETNERKHHLLSAANTLVSQLSEAKLTSHGIKTFEQAKNTCKKIITEFRTLVRPKIEDPIISKGLIFDPAIIPEIRRIYFHNREALGGWNSPESNLFWVIVLGTVQSLSPAHLAHILIYGAVNYFNGDGELPENLLLNDGSPFYSEDPTIGLGTDFYIDYYGGLYGLWGWRAGGAIGASEYERLMTVDNVTIESLMLEYDSAHNQSLGCVKS